MQCRYMSGNSEADNTLPCHNGAGSPLGEEFKPEHWICVFEKSPGLLESDSTLLRMSLVFD